MFKNWKVFCDFQVVTERLDSKHESIEAGRLNPLKAICRRK